MSHDPGLEELILLKCPYYPNVIYRFNPYQNYNGIFHGNRKNSGKIHMEPQKTLNSQSNPEKKE